MSARPTVRGAFDVCGILLAVVLFGVLLGSAMGMAADAWLVAHGGMP